MAAGFLGTWGGNAGVHCGPASVLQGDRLTALDVLFGELKARLGWSLAGYMTLADWLVF